VYLCFKNNCVNCNDLRRPAACRSLMYMEQVQLKIFNVAPTTQVSIVPADVAEAEEECSDEDLEREV